MPNLFDTGLDWTTDKFTQAEWETMAQWYVDTHGVETLDLVKFIPFMLDLRADALKRYRRWVEVVPAGAGLANPVPTSAMGLIWLHFYCVNSYPQGILYEVIAARGWGANRFEVADTIALAWLHGGPFGINTAAEVGTDYMKKWGAEPAGAGIEWPEGWAADPAAFQSGITFDGENAISAEDLGRLEDWHRRVQGEVPAYVPFLARNYPLALKTWRARYENAMAGRLPKQMIPLFQMHVAAMLKQPEAVRRSVTMAKAFGLKKDHVVMVLANTQVYLGDLAMNAAVEEVGELIDAWDR